MRLAPVPIYCFLSQAIQKAGKSSLKTHGHRLTVDICKYIAGIVVDAIIPHSKEKILSERYYPVSV